MGDKKRLARAGLEVMDRLDLPGELAAGVGRMELVGDRQFYMEQHRGVLRYSTEVIDIAAANHLKSRSFCLAHTSPAQFCKRKARRQTHGRRQSTCHKSGIDTKQGVEVFF